MKKIFCLFLLCCPALVMGADAASVSSQEQINGTWLKYVEQEKEVDPYQTRVIVTEQYLRFDDGNAKDDYILFHRDKGMIYSIDHENQTIMSITYQESDVKPPFALIQKVIKKNVMNDVPEINGIKPQHYSFITNGQPCIEVMAVKGMLNDVVEAMRDFNHILASNSAATLHTLPADMQDACMMSKSIFAPNQTFEYGFPIREWDSSGKSRALLDFKQNQFFSRTLFNFPKGYKHFSVKDYREGKVDFSE
ncbi:MAG: hypothetical protein OQK73_11105 [Gammaproteobacteria bacterium]|nr:hypothetical protein [Gammaproteobacteria bacterium]